MLNIIYVSKRSVTLELINKNCYYTEESYDVFLNGAYVKSDTKNVISLYDLIPNTDYELELRTSIDNHICNFKTNYEYVKLNVKDFGAKGDGVHDDTASIQAAIMSCPKDSTVFIPEGIYNIKPIFLKDNLTIYTEKGTVLKGITDRSQFPILPGLYDSTDEKEEYILNAWEGNPLDTFASLISGINISNVEIIGEGILDGNAQNGDWWKTPKKKNISWRPKCIFLNNCQNVVIQGFGVKNSPSWTIHPFASRDLKFLSLNIESPDDSPNTDGMDPESCSNVLILGTKISVGDDCIVLKSGKVYMGKNHYKPTENFEIRNCLLEKGHGSIVLGSEIASGVRDIHVSNCLFRETDRGLRIKTRRGRGSASIIDGIKFENIIMEGVLTPFTINMYYRCDPDGDSEYVWTKEKLDVDDMTPHLGNFHFKNIVCKNAHWAGGYFAGLPEQPITCVHLENVTIDYADQLKSGSPIMTTYPIKEGHFHASGLGIYAYYVDELILENVSIHADHPVETDYVQRIIEK